MPLISTPYFEITCNGEIDNIRHPNCPSVSPGGFDQESVVKRALGLGWVEKGARGYLCPGCSYVVAAEPTVVAPARRSRQKSVPIMEEQQFEGQGQ